MARGICIRNWVFHSKEGKPRVKQMDKNTSYDNVKKNADAEIILIIYRMMC